MSSVIEALPDSINLGILVCKKHLLILIYFESVSGIMFTFACAYSIYSSQSAYPHSMIRVLVFLLKNVGRLATHRTPNEDLSVCADTRADLILRWTTCGDLESFVKGCLTQIWRLF